MTLEPCRPLVDALVLGGGPSGTVAALTLARAGLTVVVLERSHYDKPRVGETLPPSAQNWLSDLGLWQRFERDAHLPSPGILCAWGDARPYYNDFLIHANGRGWHLDRNRFDRMCATAAEDAGARLVLGARVRHVQRDASGVWHVQADGAAPRGYRGRFLLDALGRAPSPARPPGWLRQRVDRLVAVVGFFRVLPEAISWDQRTRIEAVENGWWYAARLPQERLVAAFMTDADLIPDDGPNRARSFRRLWESTALTREWLEVGEPEGPPRSVSANSYLTAPVACDRRIAAGDAAFACDPLSSLGITKAVRTGLFAAQAVLQLEAGDETAFDRYTKGITADFSAFLHARHNLYLKEQRWLLSPFWQRRQQPSSSEPGVRREMAAF